MRISPLWIPLMVVALSACSGASASSAAPAAATTAPSAAQAVASSAAATPTLGGPFTIAGIADHVDRTATAANPADFETTVPSTSAAVYIVFALKPGTVGKVTLTMTRDGDSVSDPLSIDYTEANSWGDFKMDFPTGDTTGAYVATITFVSTGDSVTLPFTVA